MTVKPQHPLSIVPQSWKEGTEERLSDATESASRKGSRGTKIEGWWAWFPGYGGEMARRFETKEDALGYIPIRKTGAPPMGRKVVCRVVFDTERNDWARDDLIIQEYDEVLSIWRGNAPQDSTGFEDSRPER